MVLHGFNGLSVLFRKRVVASADEKENQTRQKFSANTKDPKNHVKVKPGDFFPPRFHDFTFFCPFNYSRGTLTLCSIAENKRLILMVSRCAQFAPQECKRSN